MSTLIGSSLVTVVLARGCDPKQRAVFCVAEIVEREYLLILRQFSISLTGIFLRIVISFY